MTSKPWHPENIDVAGPDTSREPERDGEDIPVFYKLPPATIPFPKVKTLKIGDRGEDVYALTKNYLSSYPVYWTDGSAIRTKIDGQPYEVAFLLDKKTGIILDISYKKIVMSGRTIYLDQALKKKAKI